MVKVCNENNSKAKDTNYICNPITGNWVLKSGTIGKKLIASDTKKVTKKVKGCNPTSTKAQDSKYICNPDTGNWVLKNGKIGKMLVKTKPKSPVKPKSLVKPKSPKVKSLVKQKSPKVKSPKVKSPKVKSPKVKSPKVKSPMVKSLVKQKSPVPASLYKNQLYKSKKHYGLTIPELDKLGISYETWNNKDNTMGTCFWHAVSKGLGLTFPEMANKIENMATSLPGNLKYKYKTKEYVANKLKNYKKSGFGMGPKGYCIVPKISPGTALIVFAVKEVKPKNFDTIGVFCVVPDDIVPTKVIFLVDYVFLKGAHIEIMTLKGKKINTNWSQDIKHVAEELKDILKIRPSCKKLLTKLQLD